MSDPYYADVALLLPMSGSNGSTTFTDYSPSPKTVTANGNAAVSNAQTLFGENTGYFDGSGDYLEVNSPINLGSAFTVEFFLYSAHRNSRIIGNRTAENGYLITTWLESGQYKLFWEQWAGSVYRYVSGGIYTANQFVHTAFCGNAGSVQLFVGGIGNTPTAFGAVGTSTNNLQIGREMHLPASENFQGHLANLRITNVCRYTANFSPPTAPFPTTGLYLEIDNTLSVQSVSAITLTQAHTLAIQLATHTQSVATLNLTQAHQLVVQYATHLQIATVVELASAEGLSIHPTAHAQLASAVTLNASQVLNILSAVHAQLAGAVDLTQPITLIISPSLHAQMVQQARFTVSVPSATTLSVQSENRILVIQAEDRLLIISGR